MNLEKKVNGAVKKAQQRLKREWDQQDAERQDLVWQLAQMDIEVEELQQQAGKRLLGQTNGFRKAMGAAASEAAAAHSEEDAQAVEHKES